MSDETAAAAPPVPDPAAEAAAAAAAAAKLHQDRLAVLQPMHDAALAKLDALKAQLTSSLAAATADDRHVDYHGAYVRDIGLKVDEILAWIARAL